VAGSGPDANRCCQVAGQRAPRQRARAGRAAGHEAHEGQGEQRETEHRAERLTGRIRSAGWRRIQTMAATEVTRPSGTSTIGRESRQLTAATADWTGKKVEEPAQREHGERGSALARRAGRA
jgi:hypothetical protein